MSDLGEYGFGPYDIGFNGHNTVYANTSEPNPDEVIAHPEGWRYMCPICGRFISAQTVDDARDEGNYYGVCEVGTCSKCGVVKSPESIPTRFGRYGDIFPDMFDESATA